VDENDNPLDVTDINMDDEGKIVPK